MILLLSMLIIIFIAIPFVGALLGLFIKLLPYILIAMAILAFIIFLVLII